MKKEEQYHKEWIALGKRFGIGFRVTRHLVNTYKTKLVGMPYDEALGFMQNQANKKLVAIQRSGRAVFLAYAKDVVTDPKGLDDSLHIAGRLEAELKQVTGFKDKIGFQKSIIKVCKWLKPENLQEMVEYEF
jgi:hypothetical protein